MLHVIYTRLCPGHLSVRVGDGSRRSEEIVKTTNCALELQLLLYYYGFALAVLVQTGNWSLRHTLDVSLGKLYPSLPPKRIRTIQHVAVHCNAMKYNTILSSAVLYNEMQCYVVLCNTAQHGSFSTLLYPVQHHIILHNTLLHCLSVQYTTLHYTSQHHTALHYTILQTTVLHYTTHYATIQYKTLQHNTLQQAQYIIITQYSTPFTSTTK